MAIDNTSEKIKELIESVSIYCRPDGDALRGFVKKSIAENLQAVPKSHLAPVMYVLDDVDYDYFRDFKEDILAKLESLKNRAEAGALGDITPQEVTPNFMPLLRLNAPAWYDDPEWIEWINSKGVATWHSGRTLDGRRQPNEYSDVFTQYVGPFEGSDYPGTPDEPGIPDHIWMEIARIVADKYTENTEVLLWVSNLSV
jgi:hypothetical protein